MKTKARKTQTLCACSDHTSALPNGKRQKNSEKKTQRRINEKCLAPQTHSPSHTLTHHCELDPIYSVADAFSEFSATDPMYTRSPATAINCARNADNFSPDRNLLRIAWRAPYKINKMSEKRTFALRWFYVYASIFFLVGSSSRAF